MPYQTAKSLMVSRGLEALLRRLAGEAGDAPHPVPFDFFTISLQHVDASGSTIQSRMMNALGSNSNRDVMTLIIQDMNLIKEKFWTNAEAPVGQKEMENLVIGTDKIAPCPKQGMDNVKKVLSVYRWHMVRNPLNRLKTVVNKLRELLREAERHYQITHGGQSPHAVEHFDAWFQTMLETMRDLIRTWALKWLTELDKPAINTVAVDKAIRQNLVTAFTNLPDIDTTGFYPVLP